VWLFYILLCAFTATSCIFRSRISNPLEQDVQHESATEQTKRNKDNQSHGKNYGQILIPKWVSPDKSDVTETPPKKSGAIRQEFISVV
jgi:hypothetical protein